MNDYAPNNFRSSGSNGPLVGLSLVVALTMMSNLYLYFQIQEMQVKTSTLRESIKGEVLHLEETSSVRAGSAKGELAKLRAALDEARSDAVREVKAAAAKQGDRLGRNLAQAQRDQEQRFQGEFTSLHDVNSQTNQRVDGVVQDLSDVRGELKDSQSHLAQTASAVYQTRGEMEAMDDWIADNSSQIGSLRDMNKRELFPFKVRRSRKMIKVGDIYLKLIKSDAKKNKYSVELLVDDKKIVKKNQFVNEPIEFYLNGSHQSYEIVVTAVTKLQIEGYVSTPKVMLAER